MMHGTVVLVGNLPLETAALKAVVQEFGWSLETAGDLAELRNSLVVRNPVAIFLDANGLGLSWQAALNSVLGVDSRALLILCHRFSDPVDWPKLAAAGAFHAVALPFDPNEVRQSLVFVGSARVRRADNLLPMGRIHGVASVDRQTRSIAVGAAAR
jgi:DNA-binding NtrC family response regulator